MDKRFMVVVAALIVGFLGIAFITSPDSDDAVEDVLGQQFIEQVEANPTEVVELDKSRGGEDASVTIVEWGDFQCPVCGQFHPRLQAVEEEYPEEVKVVFRHFPIDAIHPLAKSAHIAAEAAARQDKFWEMHDLLFEQQFVWTASSNVKQTMIDFADQLGLDTSQFETDYDDPLIRDFIQASQKAGGDQKVSATPTVFINGEQYNWNLVDVDLVAGILADLTPTTETEEGSNEEQPEAESSESTE